MSVKTILAGTFEVFSKAFGYSIQFNNDIFRWMIRKRNKLTYAGYVDVCWNDNFNCHGETPTAVLSFRKTAIGVTLLCTDCDLIAYRILIFVILRCVPVFYAMPSCDAICITNLSHCALSLRPELAMRCDLSHRRSHLLSNKSQPSICLIQRLMFEFARFLGTQRSRLRSSSCTLNSQLLHLKSSSAKDEKDSLEQFTAWDSIFVH